MLPIFTKRIPYDKLLGILDRVNQNFVLIGGKDVLELAQKLMNNTKNNNVISGVAKWNLFESAQAIKSSKLVIAPDTGMMHIAAAFKKPIISIWGSTIPEFGVFPYYGDQQVQNFMIQEDLDCRPCTKHGRASCPKKHFNCMNNHKIETLIEKIEVFI